MAFQVTTGAMMMCSFGAAPSTLNVLPVNRILSGNMPAGCIMDFAPFVNIPPFGVCMSLANPMVAAATAAALGVLTPMPCIPATVAPWIIGAPTAMAGTFPILNLSSKLMCMWGGVIQILVPGQFQEMTP